MYADILDPSQVSNVTLSIEDNSAYLTDWGLSRPVNKIINYVTTESRVEKIDRPDRTQAGSILSR